MQKKLIVQGLLLCAISVTQLGATTVSFLIIETGLTMENSASRHSILWENSLMDVFFESGYIVSNAPLLRLLHKPDEGFPYEAERDYIDAVEGGVDYFVIAIVEHPAPHNVSLRLFSTNTREMIFEQSFTDRTFQSAREENTTIKNSISTFAAHIR